MFQRNQAKKNECEILGLPNVATRCHLVLLHPFFDISVIQIRREKKDE